MSSQVKQNKQVDYKINEIKNIYLPYEEKMKEIVNSAWEERELLQKKEVKICIEKIIEEIDKGTLRPAEPTNSGWQINEWVKKAIILYFPIQNMNTIEADH